MTHRELFRQIMYYGDFDRMPVIHWATWKETHERWLKEGLPPGSGTGDVRRFLDAVPQWTTVSCNINLYPSFEQELVEETDQYRIYWDGDGVLKQDPKSKNSVPHFMDWRFKTSAEWPEYKKRLQPSQDRIPDDLQNRISRAEASGYPISISAGSMMGWLRNWMGVENMCFMAYDDPDCFHDVVDTISELVCWNIDQVAPKMTTKLDTAHGWEDICGSTGPFVSPDIFDRCVAHGYQKVRNKLAEYDVDLYSIDSDGKVEPLIQNWLDAGVNVQFPLEPGTWGARPEDMRKKFGKELRIVGGYNKLALEKGREAIKAELESHMPMMKEGGLVLMPDHLITPGVPLDDYKYYLDLVRNLRF